MTLPAAPHDIEVEQALLGAILLNNDAYQRVSGFFRPDYFYEQIHKQIYEAIERFAAAGKKADAMTIRSLLPKDLTEDTPMAVYLASLAANATTVLNAVDYANVLRDLAVRRGLMSIADGMAHAAAQPGHMDDPAKQIENAEKALFELHKSGDAAKGFQPANRVTAEALEMVANAYRKDSSVVGLSTGLRDLDQMLGGLQKTDLIVLAGRPAMGKTSLATNIAFHIAEKENAKVGFFSLEMSAPQLAQRLFAEVSGISASDLRRGNIHESQFAQIVEASERIAKSGLFIQDEGGLAIPKLTAQARRLKRQHGLDLIVVDYLQLLFGSGRRASDNRVQEITEITTSLKALAKELDVPVLALSQLSRQVENREDKHPQLADLRESGSIEQDADVVLFVYREEYYLKMKEPSEGTPEHYKWQEQLADVYGRAEIIIGKQRHGPTGSVEVAFDARLTRFRDLAKPQYTPEKVA